MSLPGSEVQRIVERGARDAQRHVERLGADFEAAQAAARDAVERRGTALLQLARLFLPALADGSLGEHFAAVQAELEDLRAQHERELGELRRGRDALAAASEALEVELEATTAALETLVERREQLEARAGAGLGEDPAFQALANEAAHAEARLERDEARVTELAREAEAKLPAYGANRLFHYLHERGYGTPSYRARGLVRTLDRFVARVVDYDRARTGHDFLRTMPALVAQEAERRREEFAAVMRRIDESRAAAEAAVGLPELEAEGRELGAKRDRLVDELAASRARLSEARDALAAVEAGHAGLQSKLLQRLRDHVATLSAAELARHAAATSEPADDAIVAEIDAATRALDAERARLDSLVAQREESARRARELQDVAQRLRHADFDSMRSRFDGIAAVDLERRVRALAEAGAAETADELWQDLVGRQRFDRPQPPELPTEARALPPPLPAPTPDSAGGMPWWLVQALGVAVEAGLRAAAGRGIRRRGGRGGRGGFTRGSGF